MNTFYLTRQLYENENKDRLIEQNQLLTSEHKLTIVLAEPGAGKTCLLNNLAEQAKVKKHTARAFASNSNLNETKTLIIDGFDEWAKNQNNDIYQLLDKVQNCQTEKIILSSRSGEWLEQHTQACEEMLGQPAKIFYLSAFTETDQAQIFQHLHTELDFKQFLQAAERIELSLLLGNPLFFKLFADAYAEQNGQFTTKRAAFESAMNYLAEEENPSYSNTLSKQKKLALIENLFAKLLLSGSEGVALSDRAETELFPRIETIVDNPDIRQILHTRFFQTADETERHRPIHRIVVEYCAAKNLLERINQEINPLRLSQCLSVIAPNGVVREDLRGLVGWLAALSENREIQEKLIELDPYAVIANGEPSLLLPTSKRKLLQKLKQLNVENPYFRGSDRWRSFSVSGFFNEDTVEEVCHLLSKQEHGDLQRLLLELLVDSPILPALAKSLQDIVRYTDEKRKDWSVRTLAGELLCEIPDYPHKDEWQFLLEAGDTQSLKIAAIIMASAPNIFQAADFEQLLRQCARLYPADKYGLHRVIGERYFIRQFIKTLPLPTVEFLLNQLSADLSCTCGKKIYYCDCRHGISNIISMLLDNFFEHTSEPYNPEQIWAWMKNLHFLRESPSSKTLSMQILQDNIALRQGILKLAFEKVIERETIHQITYYQFDWYAHAGLRLQSQDYWYLVDLAFETNNVELWRYFRAGHNYYNTEYRENPLRHHMRQQAMQKPNFLKAWY
ncbi:NACHT domain-containing NTPase, partial [Neisseria dentiae]|uniref:NACHT domain-containing protein n=1 Tax=Neisseria dentiae TaxID=194197 RepID=UPI0035A0C888